MMQVNANAPVTVERARRTKLLHVRGRTNPYAKEHTRFFRPLHGFTLVELLVVIATIGTLIAILLPAVQTARSASRLAQCKNNLKQLALGCLSHESTHGHLPAGGWGTFFVGDPDRGFGRDQPGGWRFTILPYIEENTLFDLLRDTSGADRVLAAQTLVKSPVGAFYCPGRRANVILPDTSIYQNYGNQLTEASKSDYAGCRGSTLWEDPPPAPHDFPAGEWEALIKTRNGIFYEQSLVRLSQVTDGTSHTLMLGEKFLNSDSYLTGGGKGDNQNPFCGIDADLIRSTHPDYWPPTADQPSLVDLSRRFGSAHQVGLHFAYVNGGVHFMRYDVDKDVYVALGSRNGEESIDVSVQ
jgi:prepilin-type N-terminal cleavage/methylation domain-containing protein